MAATPATAKGEGEGEGLNGGGVCQGRTRASSSDMMTFKRSRGGGGFVPTRPPPGFPLSFPITHSLDGGRAELSGKEMQDDGSEVLQGDLVGYAQTELGG